MTVKNISLRKSFIQHIFGEERVFFSITISKYPQQQMQLIRKRLKVEFWVDDQLRSLYDIKVNLNHSIFKYTE